MRCFSTPAGLPAAGWKAKPFVLPPSSVKCLRTTWTLRPLARSGRGRVTVHWEGERRQFGCEFGIRGSLGRPQEGGGGVGGWVGGLGGVKEVTEEANEEG